MQIHDEYNLLTFYPHNNSKETNMIFYFNKGNK